MKNILLAVTGLSPQIVTETLYALHQSGKSVEEIHIITTRNGKEKIFAELLGGKEGYYYRYLEEYGFEKDAILFGHDHVHVVSDEHGNELSDIATVYDNERLLHMCLDLSFHFTKLPDSAVYFSIAGGRKTMSACLTLAAQLYGRPRDRLYHVLVSPEFESSRDFFYPPKQSRRIELKDEHGQPYIKETRYAQVNLINIPFVSIRNRLSPEYLKEPADPATLMLSLIRDEDTVLTVNIRARKIAYKTLELDLMPSQMALYAFFATRKKECDKSEDRCGNCRDCFVDMSILLDEQELISKIYRQICGPRPVEEMSGTGINSLDAENFRSLRSKTNRSIAGAFGPYAAREIEIASIGTRPDTRYGILMDRERIEIVT